MKANCAECNHRWVCDIYPNECDLCPDTVPTTNADRIRSMTDEELAQFVDLCEARGYEDSSVAMDADGHPMQVLEWLRLPMEEAQSDE